jgi:hypothetical protein
MIVGEIYNGLNLDMYAYLIHWDGGLLIIN